MDDKLDLPLHTNIAVAAKKRGRKPVSDKSMEAIKEGDPQKVIDTLTDKQKRFCEEYLVDLNATQAVIRAGYDTRHPNKVAYQLTNNPAVRLAIDALKAERHKNSDVTKDLVLRGIQKIIRKAEENNNLTAALRGYEMLAKHLGMFVDRTEISGPDGEAIHVKEEQVKQNAEDFTNKIVQLAKKKQVNKNDE